MYQHVVLTMLLSEVQKRPKDSLDGIEINDNNMSHRSRIANLTSLRGSLSSLRIFSSSKILPWYRCSQQSWIFWRMSAGNLWNDMYCSTCLYYKQRKKQKILLGVLEINLYVAALYSITLEYSVTNRGIPCSRNQSTKVQCAYGCHTL